MLSDLHLKAPSGRFSRQIPQTQSSSLTYEYDGRYLAIVMGHGVGSLCSSSDTGWTLHAAGVLYHPEDCPHQTILSLRNPWMWPCVRNVRR